MQFGQTVRNIADRIYGHVRRRELKYGYLNAYLNLHYKKGCSISVYNIIAKSPVINYCE